MSRYLILCLLTTLLHWDVYSLNSSTRRTWINRAYLGLTTSVIPLISTSAAATDSPRDELPLFLRDYTKLAPLGKKKVSSGKTRGSSLSYLVGRLTRDLIDGSNGRGGYFLTGDLSDDIFRDDCIFQDPTNRVSSLSQYKAALRVLFDPSRSEVELVRPLVANEKDRTISGSVRSRGYLQLPWKPYVTAYETEIIYTVDGDGLIVRQEQKWSKSAAQALRETFTPSMFPPPRPSKIQAASTEPPQVTRLYNILNGRRPYEYTDMERREINQLVEDIVSEQSPRSALSFDRTLLPGTWELVYLQPGPEGGAIDRRIPFPDLNFNDNFQVFGDGTVVNVGQLLGPWIDVRVSGTVKEEDETTSSVPKRLIANINGGKLCLYKVHCIDLPIQGEGLFDSVYLGARLRIGKNINGGGALVVQIRLDDEASVF